MDLLLFHVALALKGALVPLWLLEIGKAELHKKSSGNFYQFCSGLEEVRDEQLLHFLSCFLF